MRLLSPNLNRRPFFTKTEKNYLLLGFIIFTGITFLNAIYTTINLLFQ